MSGHKCEIQIAFVIQNNLNTLKGKTLMHTILYYISLSKYAAYNFFSRTDFSPCRYKVIKICEFDTCQAKNSLHVKCGLKIHEKEFYSSYLQVNPPSPYTRQVLMT